MKKVLLSLMVTVLLLASSATAVLARPAVDLTPELKAVKAATAKYNSEVKALKDGYEATENCVASPPIPGNQGVMGYHYTNEGLVDGGGALDILTPEILLYVPADGGGVRLVGVEYMVDEGDVTEAPVLLGQTFDGPARGHYSLHVWLWEENPSGIFENFNPNPDLSCS